MKILIIEDEPLAAERLSDLILKLDSEIQILDVMDSVRESIEWFQNNDAPDMCFMDIQLADGLSFDIFEKAEVTCPIIFTTAYDEYAIQAFKVNSIDYLLKPVDLDGVQKAFDKYRGLVQQPSTQQKVTDLNLIHQVMNMMNKTYKSRFIVKAGNHITSIPVSEILYFYSEHKTTWLKTQALKKHAIDYTLEQLEDLLDPKQFFRLNRKYLVAYPSIQSILTYSNSRLKVNLHDLPKQEQILISREKVGRFKEWLDQ